MKMSLVLLFVAVCVLHGPAETDGDSLGSLVWCPAGRVRVGESAPIESGNVLCLDNDKTKEVCTTVQTKYNEHATYSCIGLSKCAGYIPNNCMTTESFEIQCCCKEEKCNTVLFTTPEPTITISTDSTETIVPLDGEETPSSTTNDAQQENETTTLASAELTKEDSTNTDNKITGDTGEEAATTAFETTKAEEIITTTYEKPTTATEIYTSTTTITTEKLTTITSMTVKPTTTAEKATTITINTEKPTTTTEKLTTTTEKPAITTEKPTTTTGKPTTTTEKLTTTTETPTTTTTDTESATEPTAYATEEVLAVEFSATADNSNIDANVTAAATPPPSKTQTRNWLMYLGVSLGVLALVGAVGAGVFIFFQRKKKREALKNETEEAEKRSIRASIDNTYEPLSALDTRVH